MSASTDWRARVAYWRGERDPVFVTEILADVIEWKCKFGVPEPVEELEWASLPDGSTPWKDFHRIWREAYHRHLRGPWA